MNTQPLFSLAGPIIFFSLFSINSFAAPAPCKGPNKNDPGCNDTPPPPPTIVYSATVDWLNQKITIRGQSLDLANQFSLGGGAMITPIDKAAEEVNLPFSFAVADAVPIKGNYQLIIDGADVISLFVKSQIIATDASGCPCENDWNNELAGLGKAPKCLEILGSESPDTADIAGTIYTNLNDPSLYPQYPFGASFIPNDPIFSVCRLVQVNEDGTRNELANFRINEIQQEECATILATTYCAITTQIP